VTNVAPTKPVAGESEPNPSRRKVSLRAIAQVLIGGVFATAGGFGFFHEEVAELSWAVWVLAALLAFGVSTSAGGLCGILQLRFRWLFQLLLFAILFAAVSQLGGEFMHNRWVAEEERLWQEAMARIERREPHAMQDYRFEIPAQYRRPETDDYDEFSRLYAPRTPIEEVRWALNRLRQEIAPNEPQTMSLKECEARVRFAVELEARKLETPRVADKAFTLDNRLGVLLAELVRAEAYTQAVRIPMCIQLSGDDVPLEADPTRLEIARAYLKSQRVFGWEEAQPVDYAYEQGSPEAYNLITRMWRGWDGAARSADKEILDLTDVRVDPPKEAARFLYFEGTIRGDGAVLPFDAPAEGDSKFVLLHSILVDWRIRLLDADGKCLYEAELTTSPDTGAKYTIRPGDPLEYMYLLQLESAAEQLFRELARAMGLPVPSRSTEFSIFHDTSHLD
jgi:hypothetical protein